MNESAAQFPSPPSTAGPLFPFRRRCLTRSWPGWHPGLDSSFCLPWCFLCVLRALCGESSSPPPPGHVLPHLKFSRISDSMALIIFEIQIAARVESAEPLLPWASPTRRIGETHCLPSPCLLVSLSGLPWAPADASDWGSLRPPLTSDRWSVPSTLHLRL